MMKAICISFLAELLRFNLFLHKHSLRFSVNFLFFSYLSRKCCCDAIVATKCVHFESVHFDPPAIKYSQC